MKKILIDTLGADLGMEEIARGALLYEKNKKNNQEYHFVFFGNKDKLEPMFNESALSYEIRDTDDYIKNTENPLEIVRSRNSSSIAMALDELKNDADSCGLISAGSTGALLIGSAFRCSLIPGLQFPVLCSILKRADNKDFCLLDCGANVNPTPMDLLTFARMGDRFMKSRYSLPSPKVALLSIGSEKGKGNELCKKAYPLLEESDLYFIGNIEADSVFSSDVDVLVCDGFSGNILLKSAEGVARIIAQAAVGDDETTKEIRKRIFDLFFYNDQGGAILLGCAKPTIKIHGKANSKTVYSAIDQLIALDESNVCSAFDNLLTKNNQ